uniref:Uncharacterized protein n=1 Tax=Megaselia scalaris TaxID=36166 RepID=T1H0X2_MEGSC
MHERSVCYQVGTKVITNHWTQSSPLDTMTSNLKTAQCAIRNRAFFVVHALNRPQFLLVEAILLYCGTICKKILEADSTVVTIQ